MANVLLEISVSSSSPFELNEAAAASVNEAQRQSRSYADVAAGLGVVLDETAVPVPMLFGPDGDYAANLNQLSEQADSATRDGAPSREGLVGQTVVVPAEVPDKALEELSNRPGVRVWPNSELTLYPVDCRPFKPAVDIATLRTLLDVAAVPSGREGEGIIVGILDAGVSGAHYPVIGGFSKPGSGLAPGTAPVTSHGSMCAADVLVAAPKAKLYDYPFLGVPNSGGALQMFQAVLNQRTLDGTPHITNNSYGFVGVPNKLQFPTHEVHDLNHPVHRKVREVVAAGVICFFAAGNCGADCPSANCHVSGIGPGISIHGSNSLLEVITVAAVNSLHERIGYSSQGPGMFATEKPDIASYSHFFGNFGPGRPAGGTNFDNGTSAATPVAAGVAALLLAAEPSATPARMKAAMIASAVRVGGAMGWNRDFGNGVINAGAAFAWLQNNPPPNAGA